MYIKYIITCSSSILSSIDFLANRREQSGLFESGIIPLLLSRLSPSPSVDLSVI